MSDESGPITRRQVVACYNLFLKRDPENEEVVQHHMSHYANPWDMIAAFATNEEALRHHTTAVSAYMNRRQSAGGVDVLVSDEDADALVRHVEAAWSRLGQDDAYYSVITEPRYRSGAIAEADLGEFFKTGAHDLDFFHQVCARNGVRLDPGMRVAELGCGVGRVGAHFAAAYSHYFGIDISAPHLRIAADWFAANGIDNATFLQLDAFLAAKPQFDILYSYLVLQHNPPPIMYRLLDRCLACLSPEAVVYFQLPCFLFEYQFNVRDYIAAATGQGGMEMHALPQKYVFELFARHGVVPVEVTPSDCIGPIGFSYSFLGRKTASAAGG